jgi:hypothetical protein
MWGAPLMKRREYKARSAGLGHLALAGLLVVAALAGSAILASRSPAPTQPTVLRPPGPLPEVVSIQPGDSLQAAVDAHPAGTTFLIGAGVHRLAEVEPKDRDVFLGKPGATLTGAKLLGPFTQDGEHWYASGQAGDGEPHGQCRDDRPACGLAEDLFVDDRLLRRVTGLDQLEPGGWYFDQSEDRIYLAEDPSGKNVEVGSARHAFFGEAEGVTIEGLLIEKYANPAQSGAVQGGGHQPGEGSTDWVIKGNEIRFNHGVGVRLGDGMRVLRNHIHHNGQLGIGGIGDDMLVEGNEIAFNNTAGYEWSWEAGGAKFVKTRNLVVRANYVHHNDGPGLWTDIDNVESRYQQNLITRNSAAGIFHEISYQAVIEGNTVSRNGLGQASEWLWGAGIQIADSSGVEVRDNLVVGNANGIVGIQQERGDGTHGPYRLQDLWVRENRVVMTEGMSGIGDGRGATGVFKDWGNRFESNQYFIGGDGAHFAWLNSEVSPEEWMAAGQDLEGAWYSLP